MAGDLIGHLELGGRIADSYEAAPVKEKIMTGVISNLFVLVQYPY